MWARAVGCGLWARARAVGWDVSRFKWFTKFCSIFQNLQMYLADLKNSIFEKTHAKFRKILHDHFIDFGKFCIARILEHFQNLQD